MYYVYTIKPKEQLLVRTQTQKANTINTLVQITKKFFVVQRIVKIL